MACILTLCLHIDRPWLDPVTATKISVLGANYKQELLKYIDADQLPVEYGMRSLRTSVCVCVGVASVS